MTKFDMPLSLTACLVLFNIVICSTEPYVEMDDAPNSPTRFPTMEPIYPVSTSLKTIARTHANKAPPASLVLPLFQMDSVTMSECFSLDSENCDLSIRSRNCTNKYFDLYCNNLASNYEMRWALEKMERMNRDRPISIVMEGQRSLTQQLLAPVARNILWLDIVSYENLTSGMLKNLDLPNLIQLLIYNCINVRINNGDLDSFPKMRILVFDNTSIVEIEKRSFDALLGLKMLVLEFRLLLQSQRSIFREQLWRFHCSCEYVFLRDLFRRRPLLLKARHWGEIMNVGGFGNYGFTKSDIFVPVDCAKGDLIGSAEQESFSINDDCSTSVQTIVPAVANRAPERSLVLPLFRMDDVTVSECFSLDSQNCFLSINSRNCTKKDFHLYCNNLASNSEMRLALEKIERMNRDRPIMIAMKGQRSLTQQLLAPVARNILWLDIVSYENLTSGMLKNLDLPNLIELWIYDCTNVRINNGDLDSFPQLRILRFDNTSIMEIEKGSFDALPGLKMLVLEFKLLLQSQRSIFREQIWRFHCSCEYVWLRDLFRRRPLLLKARQKEELYNVGGWVNSAWIKSEIFVPVDCAKGDLIGSAEQESFSINDDC